MQYKITGVIAKSNDWKLVDAVDMTGVEINQASANRVDKKGNIWTAFDSIVEGGSVEADFWRSDAGKGYLFAPKTPSKTAYTPRTATNIAKAQEVKGEQIDKAQTRKHDAITLAGAMRDGCQIALRELNDMPFPTLEDFKARYKYWTDFILQQHDLFKDRPF